MALLIKGDGSFQQSGPPQWKRSIFDLDTLRVPYRGAITLLSSFLDSLVEFSPSAIDPNMFLSDWYPDNHKQFPTVDLVYVGRKNGVLPSGKETDDDAVLSGSSSSSGIIGTLLLTQPVTVQYYAPRRSLTWISTTQGALGPSGDVGEPGGALNTINTATIAWTVALSSPGSGCFVGAVLSGFDPSSGGSFSVQVRQVGVSNSVLAFKVLAVNPPFRSPNNPISAAFGTSFNLIPYYKFPIGNLGVRVISLTWYAAELATFGPDLLNNVISNFFHPAVIVTTRSEVVIPGKYWRNTRTKTRVLQPGSVIFTEPDGGIQV